MNLVLTLIIFALCFAGMAIGLLIARKSLKRGCGVSPEDCACLREGKDPSQCDSDDSKKTKPVK